MTTNPMIYTGFQAQNLVILGSFSSLLSLSTILSVYLDVTNHFGTNILRKIQLLSKTRGSAGTPARASFKGVVPVLEVKPTKDSRLFVCLHPN